MRLGLVKRVNQQNLRLSKKPNDGDNHSPVMLRFMCANCSTSISMNVDQRGIINIDGKNILAGARCWCDKEHGVLVQVSNR